MNVPIAYLKPGLDGLNVYKAPGGHRIDWSVAIEPGVWMQPIGPTVRERGIDWLEVTYARTRQKPQRGWVRKDLLDITHDKMFVENATVHERQVAYEKSVSFPKPPDIPHFESNVLPECAPIIPPIPRGLWVVAGLAVLCVLGLLFKAYLHIP